MAKAILMNHIKHITNKNFSAFHIKDKLFCFQSGGYILNVHLYLLSLLSFTYFHITFLYHRLYLHIKNSIPVLYRVPMSAFKIAFLKPLLEDCFGHNQRNNEVILLPRQSALLISMKYARPHSSSVIT